MASQRPGLSFTTSNKYASSGESVGDGEVWRNFLCGLQGREPGCLSDAVRRILAVWWKCDAICAVMSRQEISIGVNRLHRFRSRLWGPILLDANCVLTLSPFTMARRIEISEVSGCRVDDNSCRRRFQAIISTSCWSASDA